MELSGGCIQACKRAVAHFPPSRLRLLMRHLPILVLALILLSACASKHAYKQPVPPNNLCKGDDVCALGWHWPPAQLTPGGCLVHTLVTGGHIAWECRQPKDGMWPAGGRWIWK